jgi:hypothetical protein
MRNLYIYVWLLVLLVISFVCHLVCNLDVDDTDPQVSPSSDFSKENKFYVTNYKSYKVPDSIFRIKEVWVEYTWKYDLNFGFVSKARMGGYHLNLKVDSFINPKFKRNEYGLKWLMEEKSNAYFGSSNNVYSLELKKEKLPDTVVVVVNIINEDRTQTGVAKFVLTN